MSDNTQDQTNAAMNNAKKELSSVSDYVTKECDKIGKLIDKCKKGYSKNMDDLEKALKSVTDSEDAVDDFINQVDNMEKYVKQTSGDANSKIKALKTVFSVLNTTGVGIRDFLDCLNNNTDKLNDEMRDVLNTLNQTDGALDQLFTTVTGSTNDAADAVDNVRNSFDAMMQKTGDGLENLADIIIAADKVAKDTKLGKNSPQKMFNDFRSILKSQEKELADFVLKSGLDEGSKKDIQNKMLEVRSNLEAQQKKANDGLMEYQSGRRRKGLSMMKKAESNAAAELAGLQRYIEKKKKMHEEQKKIIDMAAGGFGRLAEETQNVSDSVSGGLHALKNFNLVDAYKHFQQAWETARDIHKAGNLVQADRGRSALARSFAGITKYMGYMAILSTSIMAFVSLLIQARDRAANLNKTLMEGQGLTGLGITVSSDLAYGEIGDQLNQIRGEIIGEAHEALDFAATADEVNAVVKALGEQGVTLKELRENGQRVRDATSGVFTYARLMGKSDTEMASLMGTIATNMSASMGEVEARFADMHARWAGTRMSVDQFVGSIQEISSEHSMFGDNMNVVSKMLEATGKNSLLSSKQAMEATKTSSSILKQMSMGKLRGLIEVSGGPQEVMRLAEIQAKDLERQLSERQARGDKETGPLEHQIRSLNGLIAAYKAGRVGDIEYAQVLFKLNPAMGASFLLKASAKAVGLSQDEMSKLTQADIDTATSLGRRMAAAAGISTEQWQALTNQAYSTAGGPNKSLAEAILKLEQVKGAIGNQTSEVTKNEQNAKAASTHLITLEKLLTATTDQLFHMMYGKLLVIEKFIEKVVKLLSRDPNSENVAMELTEAAAGFHEKTPGTKAYYTQFMSILSGFNKLRQSGASPEQVQAAWDKLPEQFRSRITDYGQKGDFSKLGLRGKDTEQMFKDDPALQSKISEELASAYDGVKEAGKVVKLLSQNQNQGSANTMSAQAWSSAGVKPDKPSSQIGKMLMIQSTGAVDDWSAFAKDKKGNVITRERIGSDSGGQIMSPATGSVKATKGEIIIDVGSGRKIILTPTSGEFSSLPKQLSTVKAGDRIATASGAELKAYVAGKEVGYAAFFKSLSAAEQTQYLTGFLSHRNTHTGTKFNFAPDSNTARTGGSVEVGGAEGVIFEDFLGRNKVRQAADYVRNFMTMINGFADAAATQSTGTKPAEDFVYGTNVASNVIENNIRLEVDAHRMVSAIYKKRKRDEYIAAAKKEMCLG